METGLKRIEATLGRLNAQTAATVDSPISPLDLLNTEMMPKSQTHPSLAKASAKTSVQPFPLPKAPMPQALPDPSPALSRADVPTQPVPPLAQPIKHKPARSANKATTNRSATKAKQPTEPKATRATAETVQPFPTLTGGQDAPALPKSKPPSFSSHRHAVNPNLAVGLLKEVETVVMGWQLELEQTVLEIQALYLEGPIVDGWLESHPFGSPQVTHQVGTATLRHAEIDRLMEYVEEICRVPQTLDLGEVPRTGYRLCGLDADGQLWSRPCPPQQVPYVSLAIARYQKLRILLAKKQNLESRLTQLVQNLTMLHSQMQEQI